MTHEPDCIFAHSTRSSITCDYCITARAAYRRGREDAAKDVDAYAMGVVLGDKKLETADYLDGLTAAALGWKAENER